MIECIFTLDYEIYGNGSGGLKDLVYEPTERLRDIFRKWQTRFVAFIEVLELEKIEAFGTDPAIERVRRQIQELYRDGFEIGLHLHPQWSNATYGDGAWLLDYSEYNLCTLPRARITQVVKRALDYLRYALGQSRFTPLSFRAGNWLFQPTETAADVLAKEAIRVDSSVFKGGLQHNNNLDYRRALVNGYYWSFSSDVNKADPAGDWIELPIYTELVPFWRMLTSKRMGFGNTLRAAGPHKVNRLLDFVRLRYPLKLDFCRMTLRELISMLDRIIQKDHEEPLSYKPVVAIGHTKDFTDPETLDAFLSFLDAKKIPIVTFETVYSSLPERKQQELAG